MRMFALMLWGISSCLMPSFKASAQQLDIQGHRGARGLMPENSIPGFLKALDFGVTTIELDVVISGDSLVVVSHDHVFSSGFCTDSLGNEIKRRDEKDHTIFSMPYEEVKKYDCGSIGNKDFPEQEKTSVSKPLLKDVIKAVEMHIKSYTRYEVNYNIEIKSSESGDGKLHPSPEIFSKLVYELVDQYLPWDRVIIQSFDFRVLRYWHENYPEVRLSALIGSPGYISIKIGQLGFQPTIYSPYYTFLNKEKVDYLHNLDIKVIPWTVNEPDQMKKLVEMGVDGFITDYPDRAAALSLTIKNNRH